MKTRPTFKQSDETRKIYDMFGALSVGAAYTFEDATKAVGFKINSMLPAYQSARRKFVKTGLGVIEAIRGSGFKRLPPNEIVAAGTRDLRSIRRKARFAGLKQEIAISQNLEQNDMIASTYLLARFRLLADSSVPARSNHKRPDKPPTV